MVFFYADVLDTIQTFVLLVEHVEVILSINCLNIQVHAEQLCY